MEDMTKAYHLAAPAVRQRLAEQHPEDLALLESIAPGEVAVYSGTYDQAEKVLECLQVPATINPDAANLKAQVVLVNCSGSYDQVLVDRIGRYVEEGKWLVTSDWGLHHVLEKAFPDMIRWTRAMTGEEVISVEPYLESLWSEIAVLGADPQWWLWGSYPIVVVNEERVRVEAASHDLLVRYGAPVVAACFDWGKGHVFHVISHFWAKRSGTPTSRHARPGGEFLTAGMRLTEEGIHKVIQQSGVDPETITFASLQSAATATELVAQLCIRAKKRVIG